MREIIPLALAYIFSFMGAVLFIVAMLNPRSFVRGMPRARLKILVILQSIVFPLLAAEVIHSLPAGHFAVCGMAVSGAILASAGYAIIWFRAAPSLRDDQAAPLPRGADLVRLLLAALLMMASDAFFAWALFLRTPSLVWGAVTGGVAAIASTVLFLYLVAMRSRFLRQEKQNGA